MKPYGKEDDVTYTPEEKSLHPHRWEREERRAARKKEKKKARRLAKLQIVEQFLEDDFDYLLDEDWFENSK